LPGSSFVQCVNSLSLKTAKIYKGDVAWIGLGGECR
jgi:hypothetical protein